MRINNPWGFLRKLFKAKPPAETVKRFEDALSAHAESAGPPQPILTFTGRESARMWRSRFAGEELPKSLKEVYEAIGYKNAT